MKPTGCHVRRPFLRVPVWGVVPVAAALAVVTADLAELAGLTGHGGPGIVGWLAPLVLLLAAVAPVRVLAVTPSALRFRSQELPGATRRPRLRKIYWRDVEEVLLACDGDRFTMVVGHRGPPAVAEVRGLDQRTVARAISRVAPGVAVRSGAVRRSSRGPASPSSSTSGGCGGPCCPA